MSEISYVILANVVVWVGLAAYLGFLASRSAGLRKRMRQIELLGGSDGE